MKYYLLLFTMMSLAIIYYGCKDTITNEDIDKIIIPDKDVSYIKYIQPVFDVKCNNANCHSDGNPNGIISFTSCQNAKSDLSIIFPYNPQTSRLVQVIEGNSPNPMPPVNNPPLTKNQIDGIITWIKEGANCN
jgi:hypothetical protein